MKKSSLKSLFSLEKFFAMAMFCFAMVFSAKSQIITVQPSVTTEFNIYSDISLWINAPAGQIVNTRFNYFSSGDTVSTQTQSNLALGYSQQYSFQDIVVSCDSMWNGYVDVWITGQDTIQSNLVSWIIPCAGDVSIQFQVTEIIDVGAVITFDYNSGGALAALYWFTLIDDGEPSLETISVFGVGTYSDTLEISAGQAYEICNPEISNGQSIMFIQSCITGEMDSFVSSPPVVTLEAVAENDSLFTSVTVVNSGGFNSEFVVTIEKMICGGSFESYEDYTFNFNNQVLADSLIPVPILFNLPQAPAWRVTVTGFNESFNMSQISTVVDVALEASPTVGLQLNSLGNGFYEAETVWNDDNAGNVVLTYYVNDVFVGQLVPTQSPAIFEIPVQMSSYSESVVEVMLESNACMVSATLETTSTCSGNPTHILETATNITMNSANVQLAYVNFGGCVEEAMVGIILVGVDTVWSPLSVNTEESSNYLIQLTNLEPGMTYVYLGVLFTEGEYFLTNFSLSFTTLSDEPVEPVFTNFTVNWDMTMLATIFMNYNLGDLSSAGLRVYHDGPNNAAVEILDISVSNEFTSFDYNLQGQYGLHMFWAELYDIGTNIVFYTTDVSTHTYQQTVGVEEIGYSIEDFDRVEVYNLSGQLIQSFSRGEVLNPTSLQGVYLFVGWNGDKSTTSKLAL